MKGKLRYFLATGAAVLLLSVALSPPAEAAILDINGNHINTDYDKNSGVIMEDGVTLVSEDFLQTHFYLTTTRDGDAFTLTNAFDDFTVSGEIGSRDLLLEDDRMIAMPLAAREENGSLYLPLRALMENFGEVSWDGAVTVRFDYNDQAKRTAVTIAENNPLLYSIIPNSGFSFDEPDTGYYPITPDGYYVIDTDEDGCSVSVSRGEKMVLETQHDGFQFATSGVAYGFQIDKDYAAWVEIPKVDVFREDNTWYLYVKAMNTSDAEPVLVDSGLYVDSSGLNNYIARWSFNNGTLLYAKPDSERSETNIYLYRVGDSAPTLLDTFRYDTRYRSYVEVALGDNYAVWNERQEMERERTYGETIVYDLATGDTTEIALGYNVRDPLIVGDELVVQTLPNGNGWTEVSEAQGGVASLPNALWIYDLTEKAWTYSADTNLAMLEGCITMERPIVMDDSHIVLTASGSHETYALPILDLETGKVWTAENAEGVPLNYCPRDCSESAMVEAGQAVYDVYPNSLSADTYIMAFLQASAEEGFSRIFYAIDLEVPV